MLSILMIHKYYYHLFFDWVVGGVASDITQKHRTQIVGGVASDRTQKHWTQIVSGVASDRTQKHWTQIVSGVASDRTQKHWTQIVGGVASDRTQKNWTQIVCGVAGDRTQKHWTQKLNFKLFYDLISVIAKIMIIIIFHIIYITENGISKPGLISSQDCLY